MSDHISRLVAHMGWADHKVLEALRAARSPAPQTFALYSHLLGAEHVWLSRIRGEPAIVAIWPSLTLDECAELAMKNRADFGELAEELNSTGLDREITYRNSAGLEFTNNVEDILLHVALHGSYHRGQIAMTLRAGGDNPASTDYIAFVRGVPAATRA
jgi:uncharacterized damage-inducible protein DinB